MKKNALCLLALFVGAAPAVAGDNPFFGKYSNQITFNFGQGVNSGFLIPPPTQWVPFSMLHLQYSRPNTFFTLPARASLNIFQTIGYADKYGWDWADYSIPMFLISEDVSLYNTNKWYFGTGLGAGFQAKENDRIGSKLIFGFKLFAGYKIAPQTNLEIFMQHFSNGNTGYANNSYAFYGLGIGYNF